MVEPKPPEAKPEAKSFWSTLPGILTAVGGLIAALAALLTALTSAGALGVKPTPTPTPAPIVSAAPTAALPAPTLTPTPRPTQPPTAPPTAGPTVLFEDTFADGRHNWLTEVKAGAEKGYAQGAYQISVFEAEFSAWGWPQPPLTLADFALEVDAWRITGPSDNEYGVIVHDQAESDDFYLFAISSDGLASVQRYADGDWRALVKWTKAPSVLGGQAVNHLRVTCQGPQMRFFVNGELAAQVSDAALSGGGIGLLASTGERGGVVVAFDNLRVKALGGP